jgi:hypothetical protein
LCEFIVLEGVSHALHLLLSRWEIEALLILDTILRVKVSDRTHGWENWLVGIVLLLILNLSLIFSGDVLTIFFRVQSDLILG